MKKLYRILYIEGSGDIAGGGQISLLKLLKNLDRDRFEPILLYPFKGSLTSQVENAGVKIISMPMDSPRKNSFVLIPSIKKLRRLLVEFGVDIVHANTSRSVLYGGLAANPLGIPVIWHVRVIESEGLYGRFLARLCTKIIVVSMAVQKRFNWLLKKYPEKVVLIYNRVDLKEFNPEINGDGVRKEFNLQQDIPIAGVVGNLIPWKGQEYFIKAAAEIVKTFPNSRFLIVGDGECRKNLEKLTESFGLREKIIFTGKRFDIPEIIAAIDVLVHSSVSPEPFARVIIEGMAMRKPIVAMNEGGVPEVIEDGVSGILIPPKNSSLMAQAITSLFTDREKAIKIGLRARKTVEEKFSIEENVKKTEEVYLQILNA